MKGVTRLVHEAAQAWNAGQHRAFVRGAANLEAGQRRRLERYLAAAESTRFGREHGLRAGMGWEAFAAHLPPQSYADLAPYAERQRAGAAGELCHDCARYQPTSGSTAARKWIPYNGALLAEFDAAVGPWLFDVARRFPRTKTGRHYWSLSWLPTELRGQVQTTDDRELFPWWKRLALAGTSAVPGAVARAATVDAALLATATHLAATAELSLISVWSPTFFLALLGSLGKNREKVAESLARGAWWDAATPTACPRAPRAAALLRGWDGRVDAAFFRELWPKLALVSAWETGSSGPWAEELKAALPQAQFQGKGLWATEGVLTIPLGGQHVLAAGSHFYEFRCLDTGKILPAWGLREGQQVQPLLTTGGGFWRYALDDRMRVSGSFGEAPALTFLGRLRGTDLVGEKLSDEVAAGLLRDVARRFSRRAVTFLAVRGEPSRPSHYALLVDGDARDAAGIARYCEERLREHHHYQLARELGQLGPAAALATERAVDLYMAINQRRGMVSGDIKPEPLLLVEEAALAGARGGLA